MLGLNLEGKRAFVAGIGDDQGYGWAIAKALAAAGATVCVGTWPPVMNIFTKGLERGKFDMSLPGGGEFQVEGVYALDAVYDEPADVPEEIKEDKRYRGLSDYTIAELAAKLEADHGPKCIDILVHSLANGPEVKNPLLETSRAGYLAASSASAYSLVSMVQRLGPLMREGGAAVCLSYLAAVRCVPGYGGGMSSAKAALESDVRTLAFEAGRKWGIRINGVSAGPLASRAARAIGMIRKSIELYEANSALGGVQSASDVGNAAAFLCSPLASGITGEILYVDHGFSQMGAPADAGDAE